jgi:hypothetical protein
MDEKEKKWEDPIIAEIHAGRKALVEQLNNDPQAVFNYFLEKQREGEAQGRHYVTRASKPSDHPRTGTRS